MSQFEHFVKVIWKLGYGSGTGAASKGYGSATLAIRMERDCTRLHYRNGKEKDRDMVCSKVQYSIENKPTLWWRGRGGRVRGRGGRLGG
jgi:hypothetical protein